MKKRASQNEEGGSEEVRISASEWEVMEVLWGHGGWMLAGEVLAALNPAREWARKTVNPFLARLVGKGVVGTEARGRANAYRAEVGREDCVKREAETFLERVFRGAAGSALVHFLENEELSEQELGEIEAMLKRRREEGGK